MTRQSRTTKTRLELFPLMRTRDTTCAWLSSNNSNSSNSNNKTKTKIRINRNKINRTKTNRTKTSRTKTNRTRINKTRINKTRTSKVKDKISRATKIKPSRIKVNSKVVINSSNKATPSTWTSVAFSKCSRPWKTRRNKLSKRFIKWDNDNVNKNDEQRKTSGNTTYLIHHTSQ